MKSKTNISIGVGIDMQEYYDNLVLYRDSLNAQIETLAKSPSICTHKRVIDIGNDGVKVCANRSCGKIINSGKFDCCK